MDNITIFQHPLIQHKISILRNKNTGTNEFRALIEEIAMLMGYEALRDLPLQQVEVETPIETCMTPMIAGKKLAVVPILRAGLGMVNGILALVPSAKVGHIGLYRDEVTHEPHEYYCKLPSPIELRTIVVTDPMPVSYTHLSFSSPKLKNSRLPPNPQLQQKNYNNSHSAESGHHIPENSQYMYFFNML